MEGGVGPGGGADVGTNEGGAVGADDNSVTAGASDRTVVEDAEELAAASKTRRETAPD